MKFEKKLIILSGSNSYKGTAAIERNSFGINVTLNCYNLPDLANSEYIVGLKSGYDSYKRELGSAGRIFTRFFLPEMDLENLHCVIFDRSERAVLYGTNCTVKLWGGNLLDGLRENKVEKKAIEKIEEATNFMYSGKAEIERGVSAAGMIAKNSAPDINEKPPLGAKDIEDFFLDIVPGGKYADSAVAEVNYYPSNLHYSGLEKVAAMENQVAGDIKEATSEEYTRAPSSLMKEYILRHRPNIKPEEGVAATVNASETKPPEKFQQKPVFSSLKKEDTAHTASLNTAADEKVKKIPPLSAYNADSAAAKNKTTISFYEQVKKQVDKLFSENPREEALQTQLPGTQWVKVSYDSTGKYYIVGIIGTKPDYLCYGVPAKYSVNPPEELDGYCQWLPREASNPTGEGYWLMYQDCLTGQSVSKT